MHQLLKTFSIEDNHSGVASGSAWLKASGNSFASYSPINGELLGHVTSAGEKDYQTLIEKAHQAFLSWREVPAPKRGEIIRQLGDLLRQHKDALGSLVSLEMGKSKQEGDGEVQEMIDMADLAVGQSRMLYGNTMHSERPLHRMYEQWHPYGVVGVISAYNFPVAVWAWNAFVAIICGNSVIWKPSSKTPLSAIAVQQLCAEVIKANGLPEIFSLFVSQDRKVSQLLVDDCRVPLISFTGSTEVGRQVAKDVAGRFGRSILELSGNNAAIVDATADLERAILAIVFGAVGTAGQRCTTLRRLIVHKSIYQKVLKQLKAAYSQLKIGNPLDQSMHVGPLIDEKAVELHLNAVEEAKASGANIISGGNRLEQPGSYVEPTIIEAPAKSELVLRENFSPILFVMSFETIEEAIAMNNAALHGLSSAIFTQNLSTAEAFLSARGSDCGIANVNIGTSGAEIGGAFGGEKATGGGREAGSDSWKAYMRRQTSTINWGEDLPLAQGIKFQLD